MRKSKGSRKAHCSNEYRKDTNRKRSFPINRWDMEKEKDTTLNAAKKLENRSDVPVAEDESIGYRILNFYSVFTEISQFVKCKECGGNVKFYSESSRGLGFKIMLTCELCEPTLIPSCPQIGSAFEINRRFTFAMRCIDQGANGEKKFCGLMDLPPPVAEKSHNEIQKNIHVASKAVAELLMRDAVKEEQLRTSLEQEVDIVTELAVSGDGTRQKRGFTSAFGVCSLIGIHSKKVLDVNIKSAYCKACEVWGKKQDTEEYNEWKIEHEQVCHMNHHGSSGKMEVDAIKEMFQRSENLYGVKYTDYIGDGDSKTYKGIIDSKPYGDNLIINKKECLSHVQKRMGARLRKCKKENKGIGGQNKLTAKMIDKLSVYYGLAIRRNYDSVEKMRDAIWATFHHYSSTTKDPQHQLCPEGPNFKSWCEWQQAKANGTLNRYEQSFKTLSEEVLNAIHPIYKDLSNETLLKRCLGGFTQNTNESYNNLIWRIAPKITNSSARIVETATYIAVCLFNEGATSLLKIMNTMGIKTGRNAAQFTASSDTRRFSQADIRAQHATREARIHRRLAKSQLEDENLAKEDSLYGPGIDDFI
ncbi:LOW QUALITY PROTEIN: uncharacterized protein [Polyergus mexicanus]|uniref:LOW QUALITY PROTEIN: uncharacterized protein n=1 Tax=Polyergus mexicanus TaxID=615972 RepID=UPI0038B46C72